MACCAGTDVVSGEAYFVEHKGGSGTCGEEGAPLAAAGSPQRHDARSALTPP
jgi:hypothetical protein